MLRREPQLREQQMFLHELVSEIVERGPHAARFFLYLASILDLDLHKVSSTGTPPYSRATLLASIFYAMYSGHFASEKIIAFLHDSIGAQWILNGMAIPSRKTIDRVIDSLLLEIGNFYTQILELCDSVGLIGGERVYIDGTKKQANASKHKAMSYGYLKEKIANGKEALKILFAELRSIMDGIEELTDDEFEALVLEDAAATRAELRKSHKQDLAEKQDQIFNIDSKAKPPENKETATEKLKKDLVSLQNIEPESQDKAVEMLSDIAFGTARVERMAEAQTILEKKWEKEHGKSKIPDKKQINFTDPDSSIMQTKHHGVQQCFNHQAIIDDRANIIIGTYTSNNSSDQLGLIPAIENTKRTFGSLEGIVLGGDAGYFSAANIAFTIDEGIDFYASFPESKSLFAKDKFEYNEQLDAYICPNGNTLNLQNCCISESSEKRLYSNESACHSCPNGKDCAKANDGVRRIERDMVYDKLREDAKEKAQSELGKDVLRHRKHIPEPVFGNIITQDSFTQSHFRGNEKAGFEFDLHCAFQNIRKLFKVYLSSKSFQDVVHSRECLYYLSSA